MPCVIFVTNFVNFLAGGVSEPVDENSHENLIAEQESQKNLRCSVPVFWIISRLTKFPCSVGLKNLKDTNPGIRGFYFAKFLILLEKGLFHIFGLISDSIFSANLRTTSGRAILLSKVVDGRFHV